MPYSYRAPYPLFIVYQKDDFQSTAESSPQASGRPLSSVWLAPSDGVSRFSWSPSPCGAPSETIYIFIRVPASALMDGCRAFAKGERGHTVVLRDNNIVPLAKVDQRDKRQKSLMI